MKKRHMCTITAAGSLLLTGAASAELVDVVAVPRTDFSGEGVPPWIILDLVVQGYHTWNIMAVFDDPSDELTAVVGTPDNPMSLNVTAPGHSIFQGSDEPANGWHRPSPFANYADPTNAFDTYAVIDTNEDPLLAGQADSGYPYYAGPFGGGLHMTDGGYLDSPGNGVGEAGADNMVRIAQITTRKLSGFVDGPPAFHFTGVVAYTTAAGEAMHQPFSVGTIPTPGVLAPLALLALRRRRRRVRRPGSASDE